MSDRSTRGSPTGYFRFWVILAFGAIVATGLASFDRPWKQHQLAYLESLDEILTSELAKQEESAADDIDFLEGEVRVAEDGLKATLSQVRELEADLFALGRRLQEAEARLESAGSLEDQRAARLEVESLAELQRGRQAELDGLLSDRNEALERLAKASEPVERIRQRRQEIRRDAWVRAIPGIRGWAPSIQVRDRGQRAGSDRCVTCHLGMDEQLGHAGIAQATGNGLFAVHPSWGAGGDLSQIDGHRLAGCSACHGGDGRSTDFRRAGHGQGEDPILAGPWVQSSCVRCHQDESAPLDGAPVADLGRQWVDRLACRQCHAGPNLVGPGLAGSSTVDEAAAKPGPSLRSLSLKLLPEWLDTFIADPDQVHGSAFAPAMWKGEGETRRRLEARSVVAYLRQSASPPPGFLDLPGWAPEWAEGSDARRGRDLFDGLGCAQCHARSSATKIPGRDRLLFGPDLGALGQKVSADWLVRWLQKPRHWHPDTSMPDFRLSREEIGHLTSFLLGDAPAAGEFMGRDRPAESLEAFDLEQLNRSVLAELENETTLEDARARLDSLANPEKAVYLGRRVIERRGCFRCHEIAGFDEPTGHGRGMGRNLREVGRSLLERPDLTAEGLDPLASHPLGWKLSPEARRAVAVELLSQQWQTAERSSDGAALMSRKGCFSCHFAGGEPLIDAPSLRGIGGKVRGGRLHGYLSEPGSYEVVRPWLERRMPSFDFSRQEIDVLLRYFIDQVDAPLYEVRRQAPDPKVDRVVGRAAFEVLQCARCHWQAPDVGLQSAAPAPDYASTAARLRGDWIRDWILDPSSSDATGTVPVLLPQNADGGYDTSALRVALFAPMFQLQRLRVEQVFDSPEELEAYLGDEDRIARAVALYLQDP